MFFNLLLAAPARAAHAPQRTTPIRRADPHDAALVDQAKALLQSGDAQGAIALLEHAGLTGPSASDVHALRGTCFAILQQPLDSAREFDQAIALRPKFAPLYFSSGLAFASFGNLDGAIDRLQTALRLDPNLPGARYNYALALARAGRYAESEQEANHELASKSPHPESELDLWRLKARDAYFQKKWDDSVVAYREALRLDPDWPEAYGALGEALFSLNRTAESREWLEKSASLDPDNATTHALLGRLYLDADQRAKAIPELEEAVRLRPNDQDSVYRLYRIYNRTGDSANAARLLQQLKALVAARNDQSLAETRAAALNSAGIEEEKAGDLPKALESFDAAATADPTNLIFQRNAALILCKLGRVEEAIRRLRDLLATDPDDAPSQQILSVAQEMEVKGKAGKPTLPAGTSVPPASP